MNPRDFYFWLQGYLYAGTPDLQKIQERMKDVDPKSDCGCNKGALPVIPPRVFPPHLKAGA